MRAGATPSHNLLQPIHEASTTLRYYRNQTVFNEGDHASYAYIVASGGIRLSKVRSNGNRQIMEFLLPGDMFGLEGGAEHSLNAEALCDTVLMRCSRGDVNRLGEKHAEVQ